MKAAKHSLSKGFTLVEIIVVLVLIGIVAAFVLGSVNPLQRAAQGRDAVRKTRVGEIATAVQAYAATNNSYPAPTPGAWLTALKTAGELKDVPDQINYTIGTACTRNVESNYCYQYNATDQQAIVYARLESDARCAGLPTLTPAPTAAPVCTWSNCGSPPGNACASSQNGQTTYQYNCNGVYYQNHTCTCTSPTSPPAASGNAPYFLWSSADEKAGVVCLGGEPSSYTYATYY